MKLLIFIFLCPAFSLARTPSFAPFQKILDGYLREDELPSGGLESHFDYEKAYADPYVQNAVADQKTILEDFDPAGLSSKEEAAAFWINTYNFLMIAKIFKDGFKGGKLKIKGVKDLGSFVNPYSAFTESDFKVGGRTMSLDDIEKGRLLSDDYKKRNWKDARIHFAVNCASVGCPPVRRKIYEPASVSAVLDENTRKALKTPRHLHFKDGVLWVTHLFKWYEKDFIEHSGSVPKFIAGFIDDPALAGRVLKAGKMEYIEYDWNLNLGKNFR